MTKSSSSFDPNGDDSSISKKLFDCLSRNDKSLKNLAKKGLRTSKDEVFRSVCIEYLSNLNAIDEDDIIVALEDPYEVTRIEAITAAEHHFSALISLKLSSLLLSEPEDFIVAWSIVTLALNDQYQPDLIGNVLNKWSTSEIVNCAANFHLTFFEFNESYARKFFHYLHSKDHLVRGMVIQLSECFADWEDTLKIVELLELQLKKEDFVSLQELLTEKIDLIKE